MHRRVHEDPGDARLQPSKSLCQRLALLAERQIRIQQSVVPEDGSSAMPIEEPLPLLILCLTANRTITRESGNRETPKKMMHGVLVAVRIRLQIVDLLIG